MSEEQSEFGKGLCYPLGLFLAHAERLNKNIEMYKKMHENRPDLFDESSAVEMWFNGAADHLYDVQIDYAPTPEIKIRLKPFVHKCLGWRLIMSLDGDKPTKEDAYWAIQEAKNLLRLIDTAHNVPTEQGQWE